MGKMNEFEDIFNAIADRAMRESDKPVRKSITSHQLYALNFISNWVGGWITTTELCKLMKHTSSRTTWALLVKMEHRGLVKRRGGLPHNLQQWKYL